jgi:HEAT repeat protein
LPARYGPALLRLAETDPDERVRAFSVRVLGKMKNLELVDDYRRLLEDKSPFVRGNAAWALGELARRPGGREAAEGALDELRQAADDPATDVRAAATNALKALQ